MGRRNVFGLTTAAVLVASAAVAGPAGAATVRTVALWNMNETAGSSVLVDSSGNGLDGSIGTSIALSGSDHTFPKITRGTGGTVDPEHLDVISSPQLNPGTADFIVTVRLRIPSVAASLGNVMQKGQTGTPGGFWKLQLDTGAGHIICEFVSPTGSGGVRSAQVVADNQWHTVTCERSATEVTTTVDGITTRIGNVVGNIANDAPLSIGGKYKCMATLHHDCDYFIGSIDYVEIQSGTGGGGGGGGGAFTAVPSTRLLDTRSGVGAPAGPVAGGGTVHLGVLGHGGVPASGVSAVVLNVTATGSTGPGFVTAYADGGVRPTASNLNFVAGQTVANLVVVPVGADGSVALFNGSGGPAQLIADVSGYYTSGAPSGSGAFSSLTSARLLDTRSGVGAAAGPVAAGGTVHLAVLGSGGVPASGVSAVLLNVTATGSTSSGFVTAYADGGVQPTASNLNFAAGQTIANLVVAPVGADGSVALLNGSAGSTHLIADVSGYYSTGAATTAGDFTPVGPGRVLDTRVGVGAAQGPVAAQGTVHLAVLGRAGVPSSGVSAVVLNVTTTGSTGPGFVTAYADGAARPMASNLNFGAGQTIAGLVVVPVGADGSVALFNGSSGTTQLIADVAGYFVG